MEMCSIDSVIVRKDPLQSISLKEVNLLEIIEPVGKGNFSDVHKVEVRLFADGNPTTCAARKFRVEEEMQRYLERVEKVCEKLWQPGRKKVEHTNLVGFVGVWFQPTTNLPLLVSEKMDTSLADYLKTGKNREKSTFLSFLRDVACGLEFLHDHAIVHGDLTAYSVFINGVSTDSLVAKIGDLGVCQILSKGVCPSCSSKSYRSPEAHRSNHNPHTADDIYAFAVLVLHTLLQKYPEGRKRFDDPERFSDYYQCLITKCKNHMFVDCIGECLNTDPGKRPQASVIFAALNDDGRASVVTLQGLKNQATAQNKFKKRRKNKEPLTILITGKTGSGKSSLINGLVGKMVAEEGEELTSSTEQVSGFEFFQGSVQFFVVDSPGLQDYKKDDKVTLKMIRRQLTHLCKSIDLVVYCINMSSIRLDASEKTAIIQLTKCFGESIWKNAVFILTFANRVQLPPTYDGPENEWFKERLEGFQSMLHDTLSAEARVSQAVAEEVPLIPAGYWQVTKNLPDPWKLPDRPDWFNVFWLACALRMEGGASIALFESQAARISNKPLTKITGTAAERQIYVPPEYAPVTTEEGTKAPRVRVVAASFIGTMIGGGLGALLGIPGGPIGIATLAVGGGITGAAVGVTIGLQF